MGRVLERTRLEDGCKEVWGWIPQHGHRAWGYVCLRRCPHTHKKDVISSKVKLNNHMAKMSNSVVFSPSPCHVFTGLMNKVVMVAGRQPNSATARLTLAREVCYWTHKWMSSPSNVENKTEPRLWCHLQEEHLVWSSIGQWFIFTGTDNYISIDSYR